MIGWRNQKKTQVFKPAHTTVANRNNQKVSTYPFKLEITKTRCLFHLKYNKQAAICKLNRYCLH